jgi:hypothetical protein
MHCNRVAIAVALIICSGHQLFAQNTHIWLSDRIGSPAPPSQISLTSVSGAERSVFIWARPELQAPVFKTITDFSLNLLATDALIDLGESVVFNPVIDGSKRYQFVNDSSEGLAATGSPEEMYDLFGIRVDPSDNGVSHDGFGGACGSDPLCDTDSSGTYAWLIGAVTYTATGAGDLELQIGQFGINHDGESTAETNVMFGEDVASYNGESDRSVTRWSDSYPEATITIVPAVTVNTWNVAGDADWHAATWSEMTVPTATHRVNVSAGDTLSVTQPQNAHQTNVTSGRLHIASGGALTGDVNVAGGQQLSGGGWIAADVEYEDNSVHAIDANEKLRVFGDITLNGDVSLQVTDNYTQPEQTSTTFDMLEASSISDPFAANDQDYLGNGIFLTSIVQNDYMVNVTLQNLPGDYNGDENVNALDYGIWATDFGNTGDFQPADGNLDGIVNAADYTVWKDNVGNTASELGSGVGSGSGSTVPEPAAGLLLWWGLTVGWVATRGLRNGSS